MGTPDSPSPEDFESPGETPLAFRVVRGSAVVALSAYFLYAVGFLANLLLTRLLAPADFGAFALGMFFFTLLNLRPKFGVDQAFAQHRSTDGEASGTYAVLSIATGVASLGIALLAAPLLFALGYPQTVVIVTLSLAGVGVMDSVMGIAWAHLDKSLRFATVSLVTSIAFPLSYLPAFYLAFRGAGFWALLAQNATYALLLFIGLWYVARRAQPRLWELRWAFSRSLARQFLRFGAFVGLTTIFALVVYQFDNFLVGTLINIEVLGFYDRAYRIAQWPYALVSGVLTRTIFYAYSRLRDDVPRLTRTATMSLWIVTTIAVPIALAIFVMADDLVLFLFGAKWMPSALFLRFLVVNSILRPLLDDAASLFLALGYPRRNTLVTLFQAIALVLAATPLTLQAGAVGTAIGVGITFVVGLGITYYFLRRTLPTLDLRAAFSVPVLAALATIAVWFLAAPFMRAASLPLALSLLTQILLVMALYLSFTYLMRPRLTRERAVYVWSLLRQRAAHG